MNETIDTEGEYFTIGEYIAFRRFGEDRWTVNKVHPSNKSMTIVFMAHCDHKAQAITYMEASTGTDELQRIASIHASTHKSD